MSVLINWGAKIGKIMINGKRLIKNVARDAPYLNLADKDNTDSL
jgi:hypothetical protein